jgi:DNA modification methylase
MVVRIYQGDALSVLRTLESESVQACITSPPYAFLRSYLPADHPDKAKEIGSEPTPDAFVAALVEVFREVRRVLRKDGIAVVNLGDSYAGSGKGPTGHNGIGDQEQRQGFAGGRGKTSQVWRGAPEGRDSQQRTGEIPGIPAKNLLMIPFRVAIAMQADGWILRSVMPWVKRNSMPESVTDRPASAIEYLFLFARSPRYFWDAEAIRVPHSRDWAGESHGKQIFSPAFRMATGDAHRGMKNDPNPAGRSYRNSDPFFATWQGLMCDEAGDPLALVVNPQPSSLQHFSSYPPSLVEPFVKAGTSQRGACPACGAPWVRETESTHSFHQKTFKNAKNQLEAATGSMAAGILKGGHVPGWKHVTTTGWRPGCACVDAGEPRPCVVLDPFLGSGTTAMVADRLQRDAIGIELSPEYVRLAEQRLRGDAGPMFSEIEVAG